MYNFFQEQINQACNIAKFDPDFLAYITKPNHIHQVNFSVKLSDGKIHSFDGYRVQHNNLAGPYKGGLRFSKDLDLDEAKTLSAWMTIKTAVLNLPLGGGKGGIKLDPKALNFDDKEKITRKFVQSLANNLGPDIDIPAPDMYTNERIMAIATDEILKIKGHNALGTFTGKPIALGGIPGRSEATALGGIIVLEQFLKDHNKDFNGQKVIIQGMGNAGINAAEILAQKGAIIVGVADSKGALYNEEGLELTDLISCKVDGNPVASCLTNKKTATTMSSQEILEQKADILILAALENVIDENNAGKIKTPLIVELANGPITPKADEILNKMHITVLPDILMNAGGVTVSYFEYVQNKNNDTNTRDTVHKRLKHFMLTAYEAVKNQSQKYSCNVRQGSYIIALKRLEKLFQLKKSFN